MTRVTAQRVLQFASTLDGEQLATLVRAKAFAVRVMPDGLEFTPQSGKPRRVRAEKLQRFCEHFERTGSTNPGDYQAISFDASYILALIDRYGRDVRA